MPVKPKGVYNASTLTFDDPSVDTSKLSGEAAKGANGTIPRYASDGTYLGTLDPENAAHQSSTPMAFGQTPGAAQGPQAGAPGGGAAPSPIDPGPSAVAGLQAAAPSDVSSQGPNAYRQGLGQRNPPPGASLAALQRLRVY